MRVAYVQPVRTVEPVKSPGVPGRTCQHKQLRRLPLDHRSRRGAAASPEGVQVAVRAGSMPRRAAADARAAGGNLQRQGGSRGTRARSTTTCASCASSPDLLSPLVVALEVPNEVNNEPACYNPQPQWQC